MLRNHSIFTIILSVDTQDRLEDSFGELAGYSPKYRVENTITVVAPNEPVAIAWAMERERVNSPALVSVQEAVLDGFIHELDF